MARKRRYSRLSLFYVLVISTLLVGSSVWLDSRGEPAVARVTGKTEEVTVTHEPQGGWFRYYRVGADFDAAGAPMSATVTVDRERYDALRLGDSLEIRYLPILPLIARTPDRSTATVVGEAARQLLGSRLLWWVGCGVLAMVIAARVGMAPIVVTGLLWMAWGYTLLLRMPEVPVPTGAETTARVRGVTLVSKSPARVSKRRRSRSYSSESVRRLAVPYQVIELQVPVRGRPDSVVAVDAVDSGSVAGLAFGAVLRVRHPPDDPRAAMVATGTRSFVARNRYHFLPAVLALPLIGTLGAWGFRRRRGRAAGSSGTSDLARAVASTLLVISARGLSAPVAAQEPPPGTVLPPDHPSPYPFFCRGGGPFAFDTLRQMDGVPIIQVAMTFTPAASAALSNGTGLAQGTCAWVDRPLNAQEPAAVWFTQLLSDTARPPQEALRDPGSYWRFMAHNTGQGYLESDWHGAWTRETATSPRQSPPWLPKYLLFMAVAWLPATWIMGRLSAWRRLSERYPAALVRGGSRISCSFLVVGRTRHRVAGLTADPMHLHVSTPALLRPGYPTFSVPWSEITATRDDWRWSVPATPAVRLTFARAPELRVLIRATTADEMIAAIAGKLKVQQKAETLGVS